MNRPRGSWRFLLGEFVILVIGVFLGVQVDRWYEDLKEGREDRVYLDRFSTDVAAMIRLYDELVSSVRDGLAKATLARQALEACEIRPEGEEALAQVLSEHQMLVSYPAVRSTYDEMIASGAFARIDNAPLKTETASLFSYIEFGQDVLNYLRQDLGRASNLLVTRLEFTNGEDGQLLIGNYVFEEICQIREVRTAVAEVVDSRADWLLLAEPIGQRLRSVSAMLEEELAR